MGRRRTGDGASVVGKNPRGTQRFCRVVVQGGEAATNGARPSRPQRQHRSRGGGNLLRLCGCGAAAGGPPAFRNRRVARGFRSTAFMPLQRESCGHGRTRGDVRTVRRRERRTPWVAASPLCVHRSSLVPAAVSTVSTRIWGRSHPFPSVSIRVYPWLKFRFWFMPDQIRRHGFTPSRRQMRQ